MSSHTTPTPPAADCGTLIRDVLHQLTPANDFYVCHFRTTHPDARQAIREVRDALYDATQREGVEHVYVLVLFEQGGER